ncbi:MAG: hypothetical protein A3E83_00495 [Gammaproteobacteria bacterium RIFCSPHIGHO2_12_FULL_41_20]|nr:MAG: hypothetical protein A3E83_00495 [Gammaproteobacteria bacterium RIFCSPHIGHO2_12_FULL_41_20]
MGSQDILFEEVTGNHGNVGVITLHRQEALNALNYTMILSLEKQLIAWEKADHIKAVVIQAAEGRAFCAGGDLRFTYDKWLHHEATLTDFFRDEYRLNRRIYHYPKPYIALLDGITMGGGVGISIHGSHRVATERLVFAMPETGIGFFPDVGGSYFLPRLPGKIGYYLGLVGLRINYSDCCAIGLTQYLVSRDALKTIISTLAETAFGHDADASVTTVLNQFNLATPPTTLSQARTNIDACFSHRTVEEIVYALESCTDAWGSDVAATLRKKSPTSLKVTLRQLHEGANLHFDDCMRLEYRLVSRFLQEHDFREGIRAVIIDKDQSPRWQPSSLEAVTAAEVNKYFSPLTEELLL